MRPDATGAAWAALVLGSTPGVVLAVLGAGHVLSDRVVVAVFSLSFVALNMMHMAATWSVVYLESESWRNARVERVVVPLLIVVAVLTVEASGGAVALLGVQYYLSLHHAVLQNYGIVRSRQRRAGRNVSGRGMWLDMAACGLGPMAALTYRAHAVSGVYNGAPLWKPPLWLAVGLAAGGMLALVAWLVREARALRAGEWVDPLSIGLLVVTSGTWIALLLCIRSPALPFYALASGHYVQYLYFVWQYQHRPNSFNALPARLRELVAPPARWSYFASLMAFGGSVTLGLTVVAVGVRALAWSAGLRPPGAFAAPPWVAAMLAINLQHYWLDHRIWRAPRAHPSAPATMTTSQQRG
ncbi:MAG: hypothetical protein WCJ30_09740 [Deltaproteobacteria bacterium]